MKYSELKKLAGQTVLVELAVSEVDEDWEGGQYISLSCDDGGVDVSEEDTETFALISKVSPKLKKARIRNQVVALQEQINTLEEAL